MADAAAEAPVDAAALAPAEAAGLADAPAAAAEAPFEDADAGLEAAAALGGAAAGLEAGALAGAVPPQAASRTTARRAGWSLREAEVMKDILSWYGVAARL
ncbi:MAG TPA: hypothetical protein VKU60_09825 [Chloroflexota bacterium]|nr:hypothetical protein [Chloroflexota bacterium]